jgi:cell division protein ZapA
MATKSIRVKIYGSEYPLRGEDEESTRRAAAHVDEMMNSIHGKIPDQPPATVAVLSALNVTQDMFKDREKLDSATSEIEDELRKVGNYLDGLIGR